MHKESRDHNKLFAEAQEKYLADRSEKNLSEIYLILLDYYENQMIQYSRQKGLNWSDDIIEEKAHDASTRIIERFMKKPNFKINRLTAYGYFDKIKILYADKEYEQRTTSYEDYQIGIKQEEDAEELIVRRMYNDDDYNY